MTQNAGAVPEMEELLDAYGDRLLRVCICYMDGSVTDGEDAFQETLLKIYRNRSRFLGASAPLTWMTRIAINTCLDLRRKQPLPAVSEVVHEESARDRYPSENHVYQCILTLPAEYREVLFLKYYQEFTSAEIGTMLELSLSAVCSRLHRAKKALKAELQKGAV